MTSLSPEEYLKIGIVLEHQCPDCGCFSIEEDEEEEGFYCNQKTCGWMGKETKMPSSWVPLKDALVAVNKARANPEANYNALFKYHKENYEERIKHLNNLLDKKEKETAEKILAEIGDMIIEADNKTNQGSEAKKNYFASQYNSFSMVHNQIQKRFLKGGEGE